MNPDIYIQRYFDADYRGFNGCTLVINANTPRLFTAGTPGPTVIFKQLDHLSLIHYPARLVIHQVKMTKEGHRPITLPENKRQDYAVGLTSAILDQAGISR